MAQYVMSMLRVSKIVPPKRQIIKDISLSFFPGAKIGLLGLNGSGKSTVLRIMAGADKEFDGEVQRLPGISIGYLPQEPQLDPDKTVREEVEAGLGEVHAGTAEAGRDLRRLRRAGCRLRQAGRGTGQIRGHHRHLRRRQSRPSWKSPPTPCACRPGTP